MAAYGGVRAGQDGGARWAYGEGGVTVRWRRPRGGARRGRGRGGKRRGMEGSERLL